MTKDVITFSDGVSIDKGQPHYSIIELDDGYYVVGKGLLMAVDTVAEGVRVIKMLSQSE